MVVLVASFVSSSLAGDRNPPMKVMSFNIRFGTANDGNNSWNQRDYLVLDTIRTFHPDLLGGQEVLKFQADFIKDNLDGYGFHGVGRDDGGEKGEYSPLYYRKSRFQLVDSGHFWLSESPDEPGSVSWDSSLTRMCSWIVLDDLLDQSDDVIAVANTHFDHRGVKARFESAKLIRAMRDNLGEDLPVIVMGDFNTTEDTDAYKVLTASDPAAYTFGNLIDSYRSIHPARNDMEASFSQFNNHRAGSRIDFIFHSHHWITLNAAIDYTSEQGRNPSDHYPVTAVLRLKND